MAGLPPEFIRGSNDFASLEGAELEAANVRQMIGVRRSTRTDPGELRWRQGFGLRLDRFLFRGNTAALAELVRLEVAGGFSRWLPSLIFVDTTVERRSSGAVGQDNVLIINVQWKSRGGEELQTTRVEV